MIASEQPGTIPHVGRRRRRRPLRSRQLGYRRRRGAPSYTGAGAAGSTYDGKGGFGGGGGNSGGGGGNGSNTASGSGGTSKDNGTPIAAQTLAAVRTGDCLVAIAPAGQTQEVVTVSGPAPGTPNNTVLDVYVENGGGGLTPIGTATVEPSAPGSTTGGQIYYSATTVPFSGGVLAPAAELGRRATGGARTA